MDETRARATVKDVAARAGVSPKTVSNVLTGTAFVRTETRERVEAAITALDYVPNFSARSLRNGRSGVIALAMPDLATAYASEMSSLFVQVAREHGLAVQFEEFASDPDREWELLSRARAHVIDGLILNPVNLANSAVEFAGELPPVVLIGEVEQQRTDRVWVDSVGAADDMTTHLLERGCTTIAIVGGCAPDVFDTATARLRTRGYTEALCRAGLEPDPALTIVAAHWTPRGAADAVGRFLDTSPLPDAFFCFTDSMAMGTISELHRRGLRVPDDALVAGFDDVQESEYSVPSLTTVSFDKRAFVEQTLDLLEARFVDRTSEPRRVTIPHRIVARESTAR
jgi:DNA-binding LacI/PurR family transcriptional regulator